MFEEFFTAINKGEVIDNSFNHENTWASKINFNDNSVTEFGETKLCIIGVCEERGAGKNKGTAKAPDEIRKELYKLSLANYDLQILDLGNISAGATPRDTYVALSKVVNELLRVKIIPIIIGGSHDVMFGQFGAYTDLKEMINISVVDSRFDLEHFEDENFNNESVLSRLLVHEPNIIFNMSMLGYQTHFTKTFATETFEKLNFDAHRLGLIRSNSSDMEPVLRNTNLFAVDVSAIRYADAPGCANATPNGLNGEDACQLCYYAGLSEKVSSFGLYEMNPQFDVRNQTAQLSAQLIWYFVDGFYKRKNDFPKDDDADYTKYILHFKDNAYEMTFWKSKKTDRWWMEILPAQTGRIKAKPVLIPCAYNDYLAATREELPERWLKAVGKFG